MGILEGRTALVVGTSSGVGYGCALRADDRHLRRHPDTGLKGALNGGAPSILIFTRKPLDTLVSSGFLSINTTYSTCLRGTILMPLEASGPLAAR